MFTFTIILGARCMNLPALRYLPISLVSSGIILKLFSIGVICTQVFELIFSVVKLSAEHGEVSSACFWLPDERL